MKKIALFLNHYRFGGAEKSGLEQSQLLESSEVDIYLPNSSKENTQNDYHQLINFKFSKQFLFYFPKVFSEISKSRNASILRPALSLLKGIKNNLHFNFNGYDILWFNGLKVFILFIPILVLKKYKGTVLFHLRDYLVKRNTITLGFYILKKFGINIEIIANSNSVKEHFHADYSANIKIHTCYNFCNVTKKDSRFGIGALGVCSMLTPWKGIHQIILFAKIYEKQLHKLGINKVFIFGDMIYKSRGNHTNYAKDLHHLTRKLGANNIDFMGNRPFSEIANQIDVIIHPSIEPEPYGRVVMEAYGSDIPLLTTGIGGTKELLVLDEQMKFEKYHFAELMTKIESIYNNEEHRRNLLAAQKEKFIQNNWQATNSFRKVFGN